MQKLLKYIILFGIFILPLINSRITNLLGFSFSMPVSGNYEFTKVMFFNIWSSLVIGLFFIQQIFFKNSPSLQRRGLGGGLLFFYIIILLSTIFSQSPIISFLGNTDKSHSFLMWSNLVGLFIVFSSLFNTSPSLSLKERNNKLLFNQIIKTFILSGIFVSIIGLKEYFYPTFDYGDLGNRLFSTFGHPNYLSIFLVSLMPFLYIPPLTPPLSGEGNLKFKIYYKKFSILLLFLITLILTKSFIAIFLFFLFNVYYFSPPLTPPPSGEGYILSRSTGGMKGMDYKRFSIFIIFGIILSGFLLIYNFIPEKLHSFVSRFFIWETTLKIIFSDIKIFLIGGGTETLTHFFNNFKSEYIYIFENLGYTADRPHNIILNFFYHFGIGGLVFISYLYYKVFKKNVGVNLYVHPEQISTVHYEQISVHPENNIRIPTRGIPTKISLILIFIFLLFNPTNIVIYLLIVILLANLYTFSLPPEGGKVRMGEKIFLLYITIISIFGAYNSYKFYISEINFYKNNYSQALNIYKYNPELYFIKGNFKDGIKISKIKTQLYYKYKLRYINILNKQGQVVVSEFLQKYNYAENYFYIGDLFWDNGKKEIAKKYYNKGLEKLPDLWNKDSKYYDNYLVKKLKIDDHRLTSEKYGLAKILKRVK